MLSRIIKSVGKRITVVREWHARLRGMEEDLKQARGQLDYHEGLIKRVNDGLCNSVAESRRLNDAILRHDDAIARQNDELARLQEKLERVSEKLERVAALTFESRKVDLVNLGDIKLFMFTDDLPYSLVPEESREYELTEQNRANMRSRRLEATDATSGMNDPELGVFGLVIQHYKDHGLEFAYLDIGTNYGTTVLRVANFIRSLGLRSRVVAFEPGRAGDLLPHNIALNGLEDSVKFEPMVVSADTWPLLMHRQLGHSEDTHIIKHGPVPDIITSVSRATSVDDYVRTRGISEHLILKIDTQGAEWEVLEGMRNVLHDRHSTYVTEFVPWVLALNHDPVRFLEMIGKDAHIFDLQTLDCSIPSADAVASRFQEVLDYDECARRVTAQSSAWTDLLVIPKALPAAEELVRKLMHA